MNKLKSFKIYIIFIITICFALPAWAIEDVMIQENASNFANMKDFTGDNLFKSVYELNEERDKKLQYEKTKFMRTFREAASPVYNYQDRKTMPPLKKMRVKFSRFVEKRSVAKQNKKDEEIQVDANGMVETAEDMENSVAEEEAAETTAMIKCKTMKYLPETSEMEAVGDVLVNFPQQQTTVTGKRMLYNTETNIIQLFDDVVVNRQGNIVNGDYLKLDMNEESGLLTNIKSSNLNVVIEAENGYMFGDTVVSENGKITSNYDNLLQMYSSGFGEEMKTFILPKEDMSFLLNDVNNNRYLIKVNQIKISAKEAHDKVQLKQPKVYSAKTGKKLFALPSMTFYTNKERDYFEGNYPELGSYSSFGMFAGPGVVLETPFGSTLKLIPTVNYKKKFGFGGIARFKSGTNQTDLGYNTAAERFVLKGYQRIDDDITIQYGANSYIDNWFLGQSWLGYGGEMIYEKGYTKSDFLYDKANLGFRHRISAGIFRENSKAQDNKPYRGYHHMGTFRFKYMAEINQRLYSLFGDEDTTYNKGWKQVDLTLVGQGSAAVYGTGDTQFIGRIGPRLTTQYKNWRQDLGYFLTAIDDGTPMKTFDYYRYGSSNVYLREYWRISKFLTLGLHGSYNLSDDTYDYMSKKQTPIREAALFAAIGPDDLKLNLGYDFVRQNTYFGVSMAMNTKGTAIDYKRLEIKNPDDLGKTKDEQNNTHKPGGFVAPPSPYKTKAIVSDVEDGTTYMQGEPL